MLNNMSKEEIEKINEKYPVNLLRYKDMRFDLVDDNDADLMLTKDILHFHGLHNIREFTKASAYKKSVDENPLMLAHICIFDYGLDDIALNGMDLTAMVIEKAKSLEMPFTPKVIMVSGRKDFDIMYDFLDIGGYDYVYKGHDYRKFKLKFSKVVTAAIGEMILALEQRAVTDEVDEIGKDIFKEDDNEKLP